MNRQQRRYIERELSKVNPAVLKEFERQAFEQGIMAGMNAMEAGLKKEFGFGEKRLQKLAEVIAEGLKEEQ